jgi:putative transposase
LTPRWGRSPLPLYLVQRRDAQLAENGRIPAQPALCAGLDYGSLKDEVQLKISGRKHWLWRAVDQDGLVLDLLVQPRRNQEAAEALLRRVVDGQGYQPRVVLTDKLASYPPALRRVLPGVEHRRHKGLNNRAENSHRPTRRRERVLQRFKSPEHAQQFLAPFGSISDHFRPRRHRLAAPAYHQLLQTRCTTWRAVTGLAAT